MPTIDKITCEDSTANIHLTRRGGWHVDGKYGERLFMPDILKMNRKICR